MLTRKKLKQNDRAPICLPILLPILLPTPTDEPVTITYGPFDKNPYAFEEGEHSLKAGKYFLGDLGYVLSKTVQEELHGMRLPAKGAVTRSVLRKTLDLHPMHKGVTHGKFTLGNGREVVLFHLPGGAGVYKDHRAREYIIDNFSLGSFCIGLTLIEGLEEQLGGKDFGEMIKGHGHILDYTTDMVYCYECTTDYPGEGVGASMVFGDDVEIYVGSHAIEHAIEHVSSGGSEYESACESGYESALERVSGSSSVSAFKRVPKSVLESVPKSAPL